MSADLEIGFNLFSEKYRSLVELDEPDTVKTKSENTVLFRYIIVVRKECEVPACCVIMMLILFPSNCHLSVIFILVGALSQALFQVLRLYLLRSILDSFRKVFDTS